MPTTKSRSEIMKEAYARKRAAKEVGKTTNFDDVKEQLQARKKNLTDEIDQINHILESLTPEVILAMENLKKLGY